MHVIQRLFSAIEREMFACIILCNIVIHYALYIQCPSMLGFIMEIGSSVPWLSLYHSDLGGSLYDIQKWDRTVRLHFDRERDCSAQVVKVILKYLKVFNTRYPNNECVIYLHKQ